MEQSESTKGHPDISQERDAFERYMSEGGKWPRAVERKPDGTYALMNAQVRWETWQAAKADERERCASAARETADGYRSTEWGKAAECIGDACIAAIRRA